MFCLENSVQGKSSFMEYYDVVRKIWWKKTEVIGE